MDIAEQKKSFILLNCGIRCNTKLKWRNRNTDSDVWRIYLYTFSLQDLRGETTVWNLKFFLFFFYIFWKTYVSRMFSPNFMKKFAKLTNIWCFSWSCVKRAAEPRGTFNAFFSERHFSTALTVYRENYTSNWHEQGHLLFGKPVAITWRSAFFIFP